MSVFGPSVISPKELITQLATTVAKELAQASSDRDWTRVVLDELRRIGKNEKKCEVSPDKDLGEGAFLLDQVWWRDAELNDIALAVESEWGSDRAVWHDFGKLLAIKAPLKLMIYGTGSHQKESEGLRSVIETRYMQRFTGHVAGEQYVLLEFAVPDKAIFAYGFDVVVDGALENVKFSEILKVPISWRSRNPS